MIDRTCSFSVVRPCQLLKLSRSTAYYQATPLSDVALMLMRRIDELNLRYPFAGARMLCDLLNQEGRTVGRRQAATLMRHMGLMAIYRKARASLRHPGHTVYPYLLRHLDITHLNHIWAADITYILIQRGFVYPFAVLDWASRRVSAWRLSNTLTTDCCVEPVREALMHDRSCVLGQPACTAHRRIGAHRLAPLMNG
jgi:putative transposase